MEDFKEELASLINKHSLENGSNTPDYILAEYLVNCLQNYEAIHHQNELWYGKKLKINPKEETH